LLFFFKLNIIFISHVGYYVLVGRNLVLNSFTFIVWIFIMLYCLWYFGSFIRCLWLTSLFQNFNLNWFLVIYFAWLVIWYHLLDFDEILFIFLTWIIFRVPEVVCSKQTLLKTFWNLFIFKIYYTRGRVNYIFGWPYTCWG